MAFSLRDEGIFIAHGLVRLTNTRYADDVLLYAKSLEEFIDINDKKSHDYTPTYWLDSQYTEDKDFTMQPTYG